MRHCINITTWALVSYDYCARVVAYSALQRRAQLVKKSVTGYYLHRPKKWCDIKDPS